MCGARGVIVTITVELMLEKPLLSVTRAERLCAPVVCGAQFSVYMPVLVGLPNPREVVTSRNPTETIVALSAAHCADRVTVSPTAALPGADRVTAGGRRTVTEIV